MLIGNNVFKSSKHCKTYVTNYVSVRWKFKPKKPFWLGMAKSKLFVIPELIKRPPEDEPEFARLRMIYDRQMRALKNFMLSDASVQLGEKEETRMLDYKNEARALHKMWNAESARLRTERLNKKEKEEAETILNKLMKKEKMMEQINIRVDEMVKREIELSDTFVTEDNLDKAIDECLNSKVDYNYAIDLSGNVFQGESKDRTGNVKHLDALKCVISQEENT